MTAKCSTCSYGGHAEGTWSTGSIWEGFLEVTVLS